MIVESCNLGVRLWIHVLGLLLWAAGACGAATPPCLHVFDARPMKNWDLSQPEKAAEVWDTMHVLTALQGIVNRDAPQLYLLYCAEFGVETDQFWLDWLRGEDGWLRQSQLVPIASLEQAVGIFRHHIKGLVVYDPAVPATACLASTAAGCDDLLPVRFSSGVGSICELLTKRLGLPVRLWLVNPDGTAKFTGRGSLPDSSEPSSGSAKVDAYRWGLHRFMDTGNCDARFAAYYLDSFWLQRPRNGPPDLHTLTNHDYFIAKRAFFFDLSPWADEAPVDDPQQALGLDRQTLLQILQALQHRVPHDIIKIGGFPPWPYKYTTHGGAGKHEGVPTEWEFTRLISQFNAYHEADAASPGAMANASVFCHYPLQARYPQPNPKPTRQAWQAAALVNPAGKLAAKLFVGHYVGDYDSPSWLYKAIPAFFNEPRQGRVPLGWAFNPNLADRAPQVLAYAYRHATPNDFFIAGDSGAGYLNPRGLSLRPDSQLPSGLECWAAHCAASFRRWDMTITGFMLDGASGASTDQEFAAYRKFSPDGCGTSFEPAPRIISGVPTCPERDLPDSPEAAAAVIADLARGITTEARFLWARSILKPPSWYEQVSQILRDKHPQAAVAVVDPYTFFGLIQLQYGAVPPRQ
ncbi:MAG: GxGYxYP domain-containing protein [Verrucomicrobiota bacterium]